MAMLAGACIHTSEPALAADQVHTLVVTNNTDKDRPIELSPGMAFNARWPDQPDHAVKTSQGLYEFPGGWRSFVIRSGHTLKASCIDCTDFRVRMPGVGMRDYDFALDTNYTLSGSGGIYKLIGSDLSDPLDVVDMDIAGPWYDYWIYRDPKSTDVVHAVVEKSTGVWDPNDTVDVARHTLSIDLEPGFTRFGCGNCKAVTLVSVNGIKTSQALVGFRYQPLLSSNWIGPVNHLVSWIEPISISVSEQTIPHYTGPLAPPSAAGLVVIVNGLDDPIKFRILFREGQVVNEIAKLAGEQQTSLLCPTGCRVSIETNTTQVTRTLTAGQSYMIVWDLLAQRYDFRVYSQ